MNCQECTYLKAKATFSGYTGPRKMICSRYPQAVEVKMDYGCGEFKKRDGRKKQP